MKPILYIMCGVPGSGKTTFANEFLQKHTYVSRDAIRFIMLKEGEDYFSHEKEVFSTFANTIAGKLQNGENVVADATHIDMTSRKKLTYAIDQIFSDYNIVYIVFDVSLETCLKHNAMREGQTCVPEDVINKMYNKFRCPRNDEDMRRIGTIRIEGNVI